ncbi:hypothetical protein [Peribacillus sp. NJ4]|nr:hypothetical protein [Peribacillus sp. NJ4]
MKIHRLYLRIWEHEVRKDFDNTIEKITNFINDVKEDVADE